MAEFSPFKPSSLPATQIRGYADSGKRNRLNMVRWMKYGSKEIPYPGPVFWMYGSLRTGCISSFGTMMNNLFGLSKGGLAFSEVRITLTPYKRICLLIFVYLCQYILLVIRKWHTDLHLLSGQRSLQAIGVLLCSHHEHWPFTSEQKTRDKAAYSKNGSWKRKLSRKNRNSSWRFSNISLVLRRSPPSFLTAYSNL